jgi:rubrerythrin
MFNNGAFKRIYVLLVSCHFLLMFFAAPIGAESTYPETIRAIQTLYQDELQALHNYIGFAQKAESENYPDIANLFHAFATSESIHARNFKDILSALNVKIEEISVQPVTVASTKKNLRFATKAELKEIDKKYPQFIKKLKTENHAAAIQFATYAWESEKQHRSLIKRIKSGTGIFFGVLTKEFRETQAEYFVCQNCGSTLTALPEKICPICADTVSKYKNITTD